MSNTRDSVSSAIQTPQSNFVKNTPLGVVFSTLFSVFGYSDETLSLMFDILRLKLKITQAFKTVSFCPQKWYLNCMAKIPCDKSC